MRKNNYLFFCCLFIILMTTAQETNYKSKKNALAFSGGIPGFSIEYARKLNAHLSLRLGYNTLTVSDYETKDFEIDGENTDIITNVNYKGFDALIEYQPFQKSSLKLVFGVGYFSDMYLSGNISFDSEQKIGDITLTKEDFGDLTLKADWSNNIAPYVGFGFGRAIPKKRLGIALEVGAYYTNSPDVSLTATRLLSPSEEENRETIQEGFESFQFIPNLKLKLAYSF